MISIGNDIMTTLTIKDLIEKKGVTYEHASRVMKCSTSSLINLSNGKNTDIKISRLMTLSKYFDVSPTAIIKAIEKKGKKQ